MQGVSRITLYAGLFSHSLYTQTSPLELTTTFAQSLIAGVQGVYLGDRTASNGPVWQPSVNNSQFLLQPYSYGANNGSIPEYSFAYFPGNWGVDLLQTSELSITCFSNNLTTEGWSVN